MTIKLFNIELGRDDEAGVFVASVVSVADNQGCGFSSRSLKEILAAVSKTVRKRERKNQLHPPPESPRILPLNGSNGDTGPNIIIPGRI